ncbi:unnamed protein product [Paramecium sonneborni]|uniref:Uncharacterized protein n=1 Tax=Paramecium sonneborni TaxID=65129 RepID=A0A8S1PME6_9CILI|nr:unnamed protein product [Paramecium sonneborni]
MNSSQRRDGVFSFNMLNPQLSYKVDTKWRKDVLKDVNIYVSDKKDNVNLDLPESLPKLEKEREWSDYGIQELLGKFIDGNKKL